MRLPLAIVCCAILCSAGMPQWSFAVESPSDAQVREILAARVDQQKQSVGIVVGIIDANGRRIFPYGSLEKGDGRKLDGNTLFEIGSITKVFTALVLTDMAQRGEVKLDDPIAKYLPPTVRMPQRDGRQITLVDLATHTSGLPRMPGNFQPKDAANPYADYTDEQLFGFLSSYELDRDIGVKYEYSNLGFGILGQGLARRAGTDYETLIQRRITQPLGMHSTRITLTPYLEHRFAAGHNSDLITVSRWDIPALAGAGALRSSVNDLLIFLAANLGYTKTTLKPAMQAMLSVKRPTGQPQMDSALGWTIDSRRGNEIVWKNGGTGGYRSFMGYDSKNGIGVVVLANTETRAGVDDIGMHLLDARYPLAVVDTLPQATVGPAVLDRHVGHYQLSPAFIINITRDADQLYAQASGQTRAALYPKSDVEFFYKIVDAQISFRVNPQGQTIGLVLHQNGQDVSANKISDADAEKIQGQIANRLKNQIPAPGSNAATRRLIDQLQHRQVDYQQFTPEFAALLQRNESAMEAMIQSLGSLQTVAFKTLEAGADIYELKFDNGSIEWRIALSSDGKIAGVGVRQAP
jgi:serine-type D-Ala-D-Ala carboxypeptidase/endopeptidase